MKQLTVRTSSTRARIARLMVAAALVGTFTAACERKAAITGPGALATITVTPNPQTLAANSTQQFTAVGKDANGAVVAITPTWSIASAGGTINATSGLFTAGATAGTFANTVTATSGSISGTATVTVTVTAAPLATITVTPNPVTLGIGAAQPFVAVGKDAGGNVIAITPTWSVAAGGGTIVAGTGAFTAGNTVGAFPNTVVATSGTISGTATVNVIAGAAATIVVTPNPDTLAAGVNQQFTAVARDAGGNIVAITPVWSVVNGGGVINATGVFTAGAAAGTFANTVKATSGTVSGLATVVVTVPVAAPRLTTIVVDPNPGTVQARQQITFTAVGKDQNGNAIAIAAPRWSLVAGGGTIDSITGIVTAANVTVTGQFANTVKATSGGISGTATLIVTPGTPALATITVSPNPDTLNSGGTQQFVAVGRDQFGNIFGFTPVWSVVNGGGTITPLGLFTASVVLANTTFTNTVKAASGTIAGFATVRVLTVPATPDFVDLGFATGAGILAGTAVTCATNGTILADVMISPGSTISGPCVISGTTHLNDLTAQNAQISLTAAYNTLKLLPCPPGNAIVADLGGTVLPAGVYCSGAAIGVTGPVTLDGGGDPNAVFVFQAGSSLTTAGSVVLINGAQAKNVYWVLGTAGSGSATLGTASAWQGNILTQTSISMIGGATLHGRALARDGAVTLTTGNVITLP